MDKDKVLDAIIAKQYETASTLKSAIKLYKTTSDLDEDNTLDPEDYSHQEEARDMQMHLEEKLKKEDFLIGRTIKFKNEKHLKITEGSLIETEKIYIYLGLALHPFQHNNKTVICISLDAPLAKVLFQKKKGDSFNIGTQEHTILKIS